MSPLILALIGIAITVVAGQWSMSDSLRHEEGTEDLYVGMAFVGLVIAMAAFVWSTV